MGHWNHRICKEKCRDDADGSPVYYYSIREIFRNKDDSIWAIGGEANVGCDKYNDNTEEWVLADMKKASMLIQTAFEHPVIDLDTIKFAKQD